MAKKSSLPPAFLANAKKAKGGGIGKGARVTAPDGSKGTVAKVSGGMVTVKHDSGKTTAHPVMTVKKAAGSKAKKSR